MATRKVQTRRTTTSRFVPTANANANELDGELYSVHGELTGGL